MSLLHATWLPATKAGPTATNGRMAAMNDPYAARSTKTRRGAMHV